MSENFYFMDRNDSGNSNFFYRLNYSYLVPVSSKSETDCNPQSERRVKFIRNLSTNYADALAKINQLKDENFIQGNIVLMNDAGPVLTASCRNDVDRFANLVKAGILITGKFAGKHVSEVSEEYLLWVVTNLYNQNDNKNLLAHICYNYSEDQGLLNRWINHANEIYNDPHFAERINKIINHEVFISGKFAGKTFDEVAFTRTHMVKDSFKEYASWLKKHTTIFDKVEDKFGINIKVINNIPYRTISNTNIIETTSDSLHWHSQINRDFDLTVLMLRQTVIKRKNVFTDKKQPLYLFETENIPLSVHEALSLHNLYCAKNNA